MAQNKVKAIVLVSINSAAITGTYQPFNTAGLDGACFSLRIVNASDQGVAISYDGIDDNEIVLMDSELQLSFQTNAQPTGWTALMPKGQILYIKGTGGTGTVYLSGYYVSQ